MCIGKIYMIKLNKEIYLIVCYFIFIFIIYKLIIKNGWKFGVWEIMFLIKVLYSWFMIFFFIIICLCNVVSRFIGF